MAVVAGSQAQVPANDFSRQWQDVREEAIEAVDRVGRSGWLVLGEEVDAFERELADWWGVRHAVGVASGLDALEIALRSAGVAAGARVITTPLTAFATTLAIVRADAEPVWCDVDEYRRARSRPGRWALRADRLDPGGVAGSSVRAPPGFSGSRGLAQRARRARDRGLRAIGWAPYATDADRASRDRRGHEPVPDEEPWRSRRRRRAADGDADRAPRAAACAITARPARYEHAEFGLNSRLDELHAAILRSAMLPRLDGWLARANRDRRPLHAAARTGSRLRPILAAGGFGQPSVPGRGDRQ